MMMDTVPENYHHQQQHEHGDDHQPLILSKWTDEKHMDFLADMEATFVRTMLVQYSGQQHNQEEEEKVHHHQQQQQRVMNSAAAVRLDRYVPDISESTLDSSADSNIKRRRRRSSCSSIITANSKSSAASVLLMRQRIMKRSARNMISSRQRRIRVPVVTYTNAHISHQDQVVPQVLVQLQDKKQLTSNM